MCEIIDVNMGHGCSLQSLLTEISYNEYEIFRFDIVGSIFNDREKQLELQSTMSHRGCGSGMRR